MADYYFVGDSFQGSPIELNRWISPVWAIGGRVEFDGDTATVVYLPPSYHPEEDLTEEYIKSFTRQVEVEAESVLDEEVEIETVVKAPTPIVEEDDVEDPVAEAPAPKPFTTRGRPKKSITPEGKVN